MFKTPRRILLLASGAMFSLPGVAGAAEEGASQNPMAFEYAPFVTTLIAFGIVTWILAAKVWPIILGGLQSREEKIRREIEDAERSRKQANAALQEYEKALAEARTEAAEMLEKTRSEQQKMAAELKAKTEQELSAMKDAARRDIEAAKRAAITEIYNQMANTATDIAGKIISRELNSQDHERLVQESLGELEGVSAN